MPSLFSGSVSKERILHGVSMGFTERFCVVEAGLLSWHETKSHAEASQPPLGTMALDRWTVISSLKHARSGHKRAFRVDRHSGGSKQKLVLAAPQIVESGAISVVRLVVSCGAA